LLDISLYSDTIVRFRVNQSALSFVCYAITGEAKNTSL
jgi:hypothetical protein